MKRLLGNIASSAQKGFKTFFDTFTSGFALGWKSIRSGWTAASGNATASTTDYPISSVAMGKKNVTSKISDGSGNSGSGISLWIKDALNWWGIASKQTDSYYTYSYSCNCSTSYYSCAPCSTSYYSCAPCTTNGPYGVQCSTNGPFYGGSTGYFYYTYTCSFYYYTYTCSTCSTYTCSTCSSYSCGTCSATGTTNNYYLKLYNSVAGTVSEIASVTLSAVAKSIQVVTNGLGITGKAYSDTNFSSQTGSDLTHTATGATPTNMHGIIVTPSTQNQSYTVNNFESTSN